MPTISPSYIQEILTKRPKQVNEERLKQATRINTLGKVFSLLGQAAFGTQGGTITPIQDKVTPYAMNEFNRQRMMEIQQDMRDRQAVLSELLRQSALQERYAYDDQVRKENRQYQAERDVKTGNTAEAKLERARESANLGQQNWKEREDISFENRKALDAQRMKNAKDLVFVREKARNDYKNINQKYKPVFEVKGNPLDSYELNSLSNIIMDLHKDPEIAKKIKERNYNYDWLLQANPKDIAPAQWQDIISILWDEIEPNYKAIHGERIKFQGGNTQAEGVSSGDYEPKNQDEVNKFNNAVGEINVILKNPKYSENTKKQAFYKIFESAGLTKEQIDKLWNK